MSTKAKPGKMVSGYDITLPKNETWPLANAVHAYLQQWASKYVFQEEKGESGYEHWQGRVFLIKPSRMTTLKGKFCLGGNFSITSNTVHSGKSFNYVMKADSRVDGPWSNLDYVEPIPLTRQLKTFLEFRMYPWQKQCEVMTNDIDDRSIKIIYDHRGDAGKSIFCEYLEYVGKSYEMPPMRSMEDIMGVAMGVKAYKCYLIDMPRGMKKDKLGEFYSGLESLKNGVCYDKRYSFRKRRFDRPQIIVFTNALPDFSLMSLGRWEIWTMMDDKSLTRYVDPATRISKRSKFVNPLKKGFSNNVKRMLSDCDADNLYSDTPPMMGNDGK